MQKSLSPPPPQPSVEKNIGAKSTSTKSDQEKDNKKAAIE